MDLSADDSRIQINNNNKKRSTNVSGDNLNLDNSEKKPGEEGNEEESKPMKGTLYLDPDLFPEDFVEEDAFKPFRESSSQMIPMAFDPEDLQKEEWREHFFTMAHKENMFNDKKDYEVYFKKTLEKKGINDELEYKINSVKNEEKQTNYEICLFPKFIMLLNIIFWITYVYTYQYESGYKVRLS